MSSTDPQSLDEFASIFIDCLIAAGEVPVTLDVAHPTATVRLFRQWEEYVKNNLGGGGGSMLYAYSAPAGGQPNVLIERFSGGPLATFVVGTNWLADPVPPAMHNPLVNAGNGIVLAGAAPDANDTFSFVAGTIANPAFVPGVLPNLWQIQYDEVGGLPTIFTFVWKGVPGVVHTNPAVP